MAVVLSLIKHNNAETIDALRALLVSAMAGRVVGVEAKVRILGGGEHLVRSGPYVQREGPSDSAYR